MQKEKKADAKNAVYMAFITEPHKPGEQWEMQARIINGTEITAYYNTEDDAQEALDKLIDERNTESKTECKIFIDKDL